jgi:uncharacterized protein with NRDE domain
VCVAALAWNAHPDWLLVVAANRDEYHERPTAPLSRWHNGTIAGRDLQAGGTWLGVVETGHLALVTNFRVPGYPKPELASRGALVTGWLRGQPLPDVTTMNPFNLLLVDGQSARVLSNYPDKQEHALPAGVHGLSNGAFDRPWPKARQLCADLTGWLEHGASDFAALFAALRSETMFPEEAGGEGPEPAYSGLFVSNQTYGTRCSTVLAVDRQGSGTIIERGFDSSGQVTGETALGFVWPTAT